MQLYADHIKPKLILEVELDKHDETDTYHTTISICRMVLVLELLTLRQLKKANLLQEEDHQEFFWFVFKLIYFISISDLPNAVYV